MLGERLLQLKKYKSRDGMEIVVTIGDAVEFLRKIDITPSEAARKLYFSLNNNINLDDKIVDVYNNTREPAVIRHIHRCMVNICLEIWEFYNSEFNDKTGKVPMISPLADNIMSTLTEQPTKCEFYNNVQALIKQFKYDILLGTERSLPLPENINKLLRTYLSEKAIGDIVTTITNEAASDKTYVKLIDEKNVIKDLLDITELVGLLCGNDRVEFFNELVLNYQPKASDGLIKTRLDQDVLLMVVAKESVMPNWLKEKQHHTGYNLTSHQFLMVMSSIRSLMRDKNKNSAQDPVKIQEELTNYN